MNTAFATKTRTDIGADHLVALRKVMRDRCRTARACVVECCFGDSETITVMQIAEPASEVHPAGIWEIGMGDETTLRVWWMPDARLGDADATGAIMALRHASIVHPLRFAESICDALDDARRHRDRCTWTMPLVTPNLG